jgi:uncharacterized membrane protein
MDMLYRALLYIHIFSVILSIGPFFLLLPMTRKMGTAQPQEQQIYLDSFRLAVRLAKHAGHVLVVSGILLVTVGSWTWKASWIIMTTAILASSLLFLARAFSPILRRFHEAHENQAALSDRLRRSIWIYLLLLLVMLWFMVTKPEMW